jgi:hypothetical protein
MVKSTCCVALFLLVGAAARAVFAVNDGESSLPFLDDAVQ